ncbi:antibiotic biosynthesis monooxygenase [Solirubrobacter sp. CPCC 204708]|uniref:Antibiotic biosynthesis monooxygenase n=1 Tax=Solirubrobacter deserti TaxID=2282478 RepID=A0ABT4RKS1_9ACTN|nr:antibiotic biosynthesis monooxygenase [Solirubrobacter deserti]MBE2315783.1 antibiotic biosynthesis monooxygenase [Solirubrobacter deserti]MDA0138880.1 antibiotic biosynthesis monooxygenase [Solirubrobacter deserti]
MTTFINVFDVDPDRQQELVDLLIDGVQQVIRHRPGFIGSTILAGLDGARVINLTEWERAEDARATQGDPAAAAYAQRAVSLAAADPALYRVAADIR